MVALTTHARVSHRTGVTSKDLPTSDIDEYIEDAQALIEGEAGRVYASADKEYNLARSACTDLAAAYTLIRIIGGSYSGLAYYASEGIGNPQTSKVQLINKYLARANQAIKILTQPSQILTARATTA